MSKWSIKNATIWGAAFGVAYVAATTLSGSESRTLAEWGGLLIGGGVGGAIIFAVVAAIRNAFARA